MPTNCAGLRECGALTAAQVELVRSAVTVRVHGEEVPVFLRKADALAPPQRRDLDRLMLAILVFLGIVGGAANREKRGLPPIGQPIPYPDGTSMPSRPLWEGWIQ